MKRAIALLFLLFIFTGCKAEQSPEEPSLVVGFSQSGTESSWRKHYTDSVINELEKNDYQVLYRNGFLNHERQLQDVRTFIAYKVDLILITPLQEDGWDAVLEEARLAEIPVITVDRHITAKDSSLLTSHVGSSFKAEGNRAGLFVSNSFLNSDLKEVKILELMGSSQTSATTLRSEGFKETLNQPAVLKEDGTTDYKPKMTVTTQLNGNFMRNQGKEVLKEYIQNHDLNEINVLFSHSDEMTLGALEAISETDIRPGKDLLIVTIDGQQNALDKLATGQINCIVESKAEVGWYVANTVTRYFRDQKSGRILPHEIYVPGTVFTQHNLASVPSRNY
ncbi:ABC transporter substrate-binding protein [Enterococcus asini]|uniref:ABC transporter substrate-binding protein n=1 Tax=Enterococcus asini TaxID=57732 RepID=UPI001E4B163B|nr:ABC transporter substrate-binding protein [Enterococcus asini]MCD5030087.1 ABC transporter substrate-binding protein [Enterococcus asini]MDT2785246.1 ABC transporter substrate-binding protein [Enterococcus asini]